MDFVSLVDQVMDLLRQRGRVTYRTLQRQFQLDAEALTDLLGELRYAHRDAIREDDQGIAWTDGAGPTPPANARPTAQVAGAPLTYTPVYLAEKILTSRSALEGERKQVTVLFADLKGSTELIRDLDPEQARAILPAVTSRAFLAHCLAELGAFAEAIAVGEESLRIAEAVQQPVSLVVAYRGVGLPYLRRGNLHQALPVLERAAGLCEEADLPFHFSLLAPDLGAAYLLCGRVDEAVWLLERALEQATSRGTMPNRALVLFTLGEAYLRAGRLGEASPLAARALKYFRTLQERGREAYTLHLLGDIAVHRDPPAVEGAETAYREALALANDLGMRPLVAHCHLGLGTLYAKAGRQEQARCELSTAIDLYRAMDMTFWLPQAQAALAQVQ